MFLLWIGLAGLACPGISPAQPPVLERLNVRGAVPGAVVDEVADISAGGRPLWVEFSYTAPGMLQSVELAWTSETGDSFYSQHVLRPYFGGFGGDMPLRGTARSGTYRSMLYVPGHRAAGKWTVGAVLRDNVNPPVFYGPENAVLGIPAGSPPLPPGSSSFLTIINPNPVDDVMPELSSLQVSPHPVDVTSEPQTITVTAVCSDNRGISSMSIYLLTGSRDRVIAQDWATAEDRISGDELSGTYRMTCTIPAGLPPGEYPLIIYVTDAAGRTLTYGQPNSLAPGPAVQTAVTILNNGPADSAPPELLAISSDRTVVDVSDTPQLVAFKWSARDVPSGITSITPTLHDSQGQKVAFNGWLYSSYPNPPETHHEERTATLGLPITLAPGLYHWRISLTGGGPLNRKSFYGLAGDSVFPGGFAGELLVINRAIVEQNPPVVTRISLTPEKTPISGRPVLVEVTAEIHDDAGIAGATAEMLEESGVLYAASPPIPMVLVGGAAKAGVWRGREMVRLPTQQDFVLRLSVVDTSRNQRIYQDVFMEYDFFNKSAVPIPVGWPSRYSGNGPFELYYSDPYRGWRNGHTGLAGVLGDLAADADGDGIANALEFICATDPLLPSQPGGPDPAAGRAPRLVAGGWELEPSGRNNELGWGPPPVLSGWKSSTLLPGSWVPVPPVTVSGKQRFLLDPPAPGRPQQFLRLTVGP
ncbi:MAG: hypothetical protein JWL81_2774 [Verrucomicrobiales bacterium]|nr:hypothetical protein [Verrucomicrobiales bacterium]